MSLASLTEKLVRGPADKLSKSYQEDVTHHAWSGQVEGGLGGESYTDQTLKALVNQNVHKHKMDNGETVDVQAELTFLVTVPNTTATGRINPIDHRDFFTLADGTYAPVVDAKGLRYPAGQRPFVLQVWLGV